MTAELASVVREGLLLVLLLAAPILVAALIAGVLSGLVASFTQLTDPAVAIVPRVVAIGAAIALFAPAIAHQLEAFSARVWPLVIAAGSATGGG